MHKGKVLVIDDEPMICWSIEQTLSSVGYEVSAAHSAAEGVAAFGELLPDVVFLDLRLPDLDGLHLLQKIKESERGRITAVILMSAYGKPGTAEEAARLGACKYLQKPLDFDRLHQMVEEILQGTPADSTGGSSP